MRVPIAHLALGASLAFVASCSSSGTGSGSPARSTAQANSTSARISGQSAASPSRAEQASGSGQPSTSGVKQPCLSGAVVSRALGERLGEPAVQASGPLRLCRYTPAGTHNTILIRLQSGATAAGFAAEQAQFENVGQHPLPLAGVGDQAFSSTITGAAIVVRTVIARKGATEVQVTSSATVAQEAALAIRLLG
jgi:hypothetical protein